MTSPSDVTLSDSSAHMSVATIDGGIGYILPIPEREYRRFNMLQTKMVQGLVHTAGLNPKAHRLYRTERRIQSVSQKNLLDGQLLWQYVELSNLEQSLLAKQIGTEPHQVGCYGD